MKCRYFTLFLAIAGWLALVSCSEGRRGNIRFNDDRDEAADDANSAKSDRKKQRDADFVFEAVAGHYGEIKLAELAIQRSHTPEIHRLAERLQRDHASSLNELKILAQEKAMSVPVEESVDAKRSLQRHADESGAEFDRKWCEEMLDMHEESIRQFQERLSDTEDPELKAYLQKTLPILRDHDASFKECSNRIADKRG